jgi:biotin synthase
MTLANLPEHPESVPINQLVQVPGTPLEGSAPVDPLDFVRAIAAARLMMPRSHVRLSAGRQQMSDELQALCFLAGANSVFYGEKLLTTGNPDVERDRRLLARLGLRPESFLVNNPGSLPSVPEGSQPPCTRNEETAA